MKIIDNTTKPASTTFADLLSGTVFKYGDVVVVKAMEGQAIDLGDGDAYYPSPEWVVETVYPDAVLYLHGAPNE